jgi:hypothetical protein
MTEVFCSCTTETHYFDVSVYVGNGVIARTVLCLACGEARRPHDVAKFIRGTISDFARSDVRDVYRFTFDKSLDSAFFKIARRMRVHECRASADFEVTRRLGIGSKEVWRKCCVCENNILYSIRSIDGDQEVLLPPRLSPVIGLRDYVQESEFETKNKESIEEFLNTPVEKYRLYAKSPHQIPAPYMPTEKTLLSRVKELEDENLSLRREVAALRLERGEGAVVSAPEARPKITIYCQGDDE